MCITEKTEETEAMRPKTRAQWGKRQYVVPVEERNNWVKHGAKYDDKLGNFVGQQGQIVTDEPVMKEIVAEAHGWAHVGVKQIEEQLKTYWYPELKAFVHKWLRECKIYQEHNPRVPLKPAPGEIPKPEGPGRQIVVDWDGHGVQVGEKGFY